MPPANHFRHQIYTDAAPTAPFFLLQPDDLPPVDSDEFHRRMRHVGERLRAAGVAAIYLIHGTFAGTDAFGLIEDFARLFPQAAERLRWLVKRTIDTVVSEVGNYTADYARLFETTISGDSSPPIPVRRFLWTSENHHLGRAHAAVQLIDEISSLRLEPDQRVLLWGHSHGGNILALVTNLLAADEAARERFFAATNGYLSPATRTARAGFAWERVREWLGQPARPLVGGNLDLVTFGTPVRYGWDTNGYSRLLHFIHHRCVDGLPKYRTHFPPGVRSMLRATGGDYVQHAAMAGTNFPPHPFAIPTWVADRRLNSLLQPGHRFRDLWWRLRLGQRVPDEGTTLLVDYGLPREWVFGHLLGHAVYTHRNWFLFHAEEVARQFYEPAVTSLVGSTSPIP